MKTKLLLLTALFFAFMLVSVPQASAQNMNGVLSLDTTSAERGDQIAIGLYLSNNDINLAGFTIPLYYPENTLILDSVTYDGSFITGEFNTLVDSTSRTNCVRISAIPADITQNPVPEMLSPNGLLATIHFTVANDAAPGYATLDSLNVIEYIGSYTDLTYAINMTDGSGTMVYFPNFESGGVNVMVPTAVNDDNLGVLPSDFSLAQNYPNPFNPSTIIEFTLPRTSNVSLDIFNVLGQKVSTLINGQLSAGQHSVEFNAEDQPSGIFFYRLAYDDGAITKKMIFIK